MAVTTLYLYPASTTGQNYASGTHADIDDPFDAADGLATVASLLAANDGATSRSAYTSFGLTAIPSGLGINWIKLHFKVAKLRSGGGWTAEPIVHFGVRPASSATYYDSAVTIVDSAGTMAVSGTYGVTNLPSYNINTASWDAGTGFAEATATFASDPTGGSWTVDKLRALLVSFWASGGIGSPGGGTNLPPGVSGSGFYVSVTSFYVEVNATLPSANIEQIRAQLSAYARAAADGSGLIQIKRPLAMATVDVGDVIAIADPDAPSADGTGWGVTQPQMRHGIVLDKSVDLSSHTVDITAMDAYRYHCGLWLSAKHDLGYTDDGQGVALLTSGPALEYGRSTVGYIQRHANDMTHVEVAANKIRWAPNGLGLFPASQAVTWNNSFSIWTGSAFSYWNTDVGGVSYSLTNVTSDFLFDVSGLRGCAQCAAAASSYCGLWTAWTAPGNGYIKTNIISKTITAGSPSNFWRVYDVSNALYWNQATLSWSASVVNNALASDASPGQWVSTWSPTFSVTSGSQYYISMYASNGGTVRLGYANFWYSASRFGADHQRPPLVTTTAAISEVADGAAIQNPPSAKSWSTGMGTGIATFVGEWDTRDMDYGTAWNNSSTYAECRVISLNWVDTNNHEMVTVMKGIPSSPKSVRFTFRRRVAGVSYDASAYITTNAAAFTPGALYKVAWRWKATGTELGLPSYSISVFCWSSQMTTGTVRTETVTAVASPLDAVTSYVYLGSGLAQPLCGHMQGFEVVPYVLQDDEIYRRMRV